MVSAAVNDHYNTPKNLNKSKIFMKVVNDTQLEGNASITVECGVIPVDSDRVTQWSGKCWICPFALKNVYYTLWVQEMQSVYLHPVLVRLYKQDNLLSDGNYLLWQIIEYRHKPDFSHHGVIFIGRQEEFGAARTAEEWICFQKNKKESISSFHAIIS